MMVKNNNSITSASLFLSIILPVFCSCQLAAPKPGTAHATQSPADGNNMVINTVGEIPIPPGYTRFDGRDSSFAHWLRQVKIRKDRRVYLYNGQLKKNQEAQFAVLDIPVGAKDLQQCADAVMRLRASFLYDAGRIPEISFSDNDGKKYNCPRVPDPKTFDLYLEKVFAACGTLSLSKQLRKVTVFTQVQPGDVLIRGGSPGHAVIVMDVAVSGQGQKIYLLAQSYMPAQDIHILKNPMDEDTSPWYSANTDNFLIYTPEWTFAKEELRRW